MPTDRLANALYLGAGALLVYALFAWLVSLPLFALHRVDVRGELRHVSEEGVRLAAGRGVRGNFFTVDLDDVRTAFEKLPWVDEARVSRRWPDTLVVELSEHVPLARWNDSSLVSTEGEVFSAAYAAKLPRLSGFEGAGREVVEAYRLYGRMLAPLNLRITELSLSPRRAWRLKTDSGLEIALGRKDVASRLERFAALYRKLSERLGAAPTYADLRYADGFAVKLPPAGQNLKGQS
ncbi:MAG: cell division protein FtsQ/DivIB [Pseudomonadota bacterium]